jgi:CDP-diacylglycerol--serine O-phosphatidyltransferase
MKLRKLMFVLPNLFTVSSIFCGVYAILLSSGEATPNQLYIAAIAIFFANFFDAFDGRVARLTRTQSEFGVQLDSLADVVSFGVAPAVLVYKWALAPLGLVGFVIAALYTACGAMRLARFNVMAQKDHGVSRFFTGLPIPLAAGMLVSLVIAHHHAVGGEVVGHWPVAALVLVLSYLMVSNIRYRTFKDVGLNPKSLLLFLLVCLAGVVVAARMRPSFVLVTYFSAYLLLGLAEEIVFFRRRRAEEKTAAAEEAEEAAEEAAEASEPVLPAEEDAEEPEEDAPPGRFV